MRRACSYAQYIAVASAAVLRAEGAGVVIKKSRSPIAADDVLRIFNDQCIAELAKISKLPAGADLRRFAEGVREAARIYARDARIRTTNELHSEIATLCAAASRKRYEQVAAVIEKLSQEARDLLNGRGAPPNLKRELPSPDALRDPVRQKRACETIAALCQFGGSYVDGRRRPSGKRSRSWRPLIFAPERRRHFSKRAAERDFVMWLSVAWTEGSGKPPARTARHSALGPFARLVHNCLCLVGAKDADAVELINELNRRRLEMSRHVPKDIDEFIAVT
jgi:hypothetical protein